MRAPDWLTARPVAHRGLHDGAHGIIENTASAAAAAIAGRYGIEADLQISADGEAMVHHDDALGRLTDGAGTLRDMSAAALRRRLRGRLRTRRLCGWLLLLLSVPVDTAPVAVSAGAGR